MHSIKIKYLFKSNPSISCQSCPFLPIYKTLGSAACDIYAYIQKDIVIKPAKIALIETGLFIKVPNGFEAQIRSRSGLALQFGIVVLNSPGTIDSDYTGEIKVILANFGEGDFVVKNGMRIAQMAFCKVARAKFIKAKKIKNTARGGGGFGSTGGFL